jgi:hypothetical protein
MKAHRSFLALLLITSLILLAARGEGFPAAAGPARAPAAEWRVCLAGPPTCDYATVQAAVDAAGPGDTIKLAAGTYTDLVYREGVTQVVYITKSVTLVGGYTTAFAEPPDPAANLTILDAMGGGRVVYITGTIAPALEGLRIAQGDATGLGGGPWPYDGVGGGLYIVSATATISNCDIVSNYGSTAGYGGGGGVYLWWSDSLLAGNDIRANLAGIYPAGLSEGGGVAMSESAATLEGNDIHDNTANDAGYGIGGGIYMECFANPGHPVLHNNVVRANWASGSGGRGSGGGIFAGYGSNPEMINNALTGNTSGGTTNSKGAGLYAEYADFTMTHTTINANAGYDSSGVCADGSHIHMVNSVVTWQAGTAITATSGSAVTLTGVLWFSNGGNVGGPGTISVTGALTGSPNYAVDGYHVLTPSQAIDNGGATAVTDDIDGEARPYGAGPDLGADEWLPCVAVSGVSILGPTSGYTDTTYTFDAIPLPGNATPPFTYTWSPAPAAGQGTAAAEYAWTSAGTYVITATVENCGGSIAGPHTIVITDTPSPCPSPLSGVSIAGPTEGFVGFPLPFAATILPANATTPITYTWSPPPDSGQGTPEAVYSWLTPNTYAVGVDAENCGGSVSDMVMIAIHSQISGTVDPTMGITLVYTDYQGVSTTVEIPAGAVTMTTLLAFVPVFSPTHPVSPGLAFANHNFGLNAYRFGPLPGFTFVEPVTVSIGYSDADARWLDEASLGLYYWDGTAWADAASTCTPASSYARDPVQNTLAIAICHLSDWGMMGVPLPRYDIYLPAVYR